MQSPTNIREVLPEENTESWRFLILGSDDGLRLVTPYEGPRPVSEKLFALSNCGDLFVAAGANGIIAGKLSDLRTAVKDKSLDGLLKHEFQFPGRVRHIVFSADERFIALCSDGGEIFIYSVEKVMGAGSLENPACKLQADGPILDIQCRPGTNNEFTVLEESGSLKQIRSSTQSITHVASDVTAISWSPKGKQLLAGLKDGSIVQLQPDGTKAYVFEKLDEIESGAYAKTLTWLHAHTFLVVYIKPASTEDDETEIMPFICQRDRANMQHIWYRISELCPPLDPQDGWWYTQVLRDWRQDLPYLLAMSFTPSPDISLLTEKQSFQMSEDSDRASLPFTEDDTSPSGMDLDISSTDPVKEPCPGAGETSPLPILWVLNNEGSLCGWYIVDKDSAKDGTTNLNTTLESYNSRITSAKNNEMADSASSSAIGSVPKNPAFGNQSSFSAAFTSAKSSWGGPSNVFGNGENRAFGQNGSGFGGAFGQSSITDKPFGSGSSFSQSSSHSEGSESKPSAFNTSSNQLVGQSSFGANTKPDEPKFGQHSFGAFSGGETSKEPKFGQHSFGAFSSGQKPEEPKFGRHSFGSSNQAPKFGQSTFGQSSFGSFSQEPKFGQSSLDSNSLSMGKNVGNHIFGGDGSTNAFSASSGNAFAQTNAFAKIGKEVEEDDTEPGLNDIPSKGADIFNQSGGVGSQKQNIPAVVKPEEPQTDFSVSNTSLQELSKKQEMLSSSDEDEDPGSNLSDSSDEDDDIVKGASDSTMPLAQPPLGAQGGLNFGFGQKAMPQGTPQFSFGQKTGKSSLETGISGLDGLSLGGDGSQAGKNSPQHVPEEEEKGADQIEKNTDEVEKLAQEDDKKEEGQGKDDKPEASVKREEEEGKKDRLGKDSEKSAEKVTLKEKEVSEEPKTEDLSPSKGQEEDLEEKPVEDYKSVSEPLPPPPPPVPDMSKFKALNLGSDGKPSIPQEEGSGDKSSEPPLSPPPPPPPPPAPDMSKFKSMSLGSDGMPSIPQEEESNDESEEDSVSATSPHPPPPPPVPDMSKFQAISLGSDGKPSTQENRTGSSIFGNFSAPRQGTFTGFGQSLEANKEEHSSLFGKPVATDKGKSLFENQLGSLGADQSHSKAALDFKSGTGSLFGSTTTLGSTEHGPEQPELTRLKAFGDGQTDQSNKPAEGTSGDGAPAFEASKPSTSDEGYEDLSTPGEYSRGEDEGSEFEVVEGEKESNGEEEFAHINEEEEEEEEEYDVESEQTPEPDYYTMPDFPDFIPTKSAVISEDEEFTSQFDQYYLETEAQFEIMHLNARSMSHYVDWHSYQDERAPHEMEDVWLKDKWRLSDSSDVSYLADTLLSQVSKYREETKEDDSKIEELKKSLTSVALQLSRAQELVRYKSGEVSKRALELRSLPVNAVELQRQLRKKTSDVEEYLGNIESEVNVLKSRLSRYGSSTAPSLFGIRDSIDRITDLAYKKSEKVNELKRELQPRRRSNTSISSTPIKGGADISRVVSTPGSVNRETIIDEVDFLSKRSQSKFKKSVGDILRRRNGDEVLKNNPVQRH